jgi:hypothetical protein
MWTFIVIIYNEQSWYRLDVVVTSRWLGNLVTVPTALHVLCTVPFTFSISFFYHINFCLKKPVLFSNQQMHKHVFAFVGYWILSENARWKQYKTSTSCLSWLNPTFVLYFPCWRTPEQMLLKNALCKQWKPMEGGGEGLYSRPSWYVPSEEVPWYPLHRRVGGPESQSGYFREQINPFPLLGIKPWFLGCPAHSLLTISAVLSRFILKT